MFPRLSIVASIGVGIQHKKPAQDRRSICVANKRRRQQAASERSFVAIGGLFLEDFHLLSIYIVGKECQNVPAR